MSEQPQRWSFSPAVTAGAYATGTEVGALVSLGDAGAGIIQTVMVTVATALTTPYDVIFFSDVPPTGTYTDNTTLAVAVADLPYVVGVAHCVDVVSGGAPQIIQATTCAIPWHGKLWAVIVARGAVTFASTSAVTLNVVVI